MKTIVYGANLSAHYATKILDLMGYEIIAYIDLFLKEKYIELPAEIPLYNDLESFVASVRNSSEPELIVVALGSIEVSNEIKEDLRKKFPFRVVTVHEQPYCEVYKMLKQSDERIMNYLTEQGWYISSIEKKPLNGNGEPIPWINYPSLDFLNERIKTDFRVFEWGSGNSTIWWSNKVEEIISVEHDYNWYKYVKELINNKNTNIIHKELIYGEDYCREIGNHGLFDVVIIDGRDRSNCAKNSIENLKNNGIIVWDDTERSYYKEGIDYLKKKGFKMLTFSGMKPLNKEKSQTSIFYRENNCLDL